MTLGIFFVLGNLWLEMMVVAMASVTMVFVIVATIRVVVCCM